MERRDVLAASAAVLAIVPWRRLKAQTPPATPAPPPASSSTPASNAAASSTQASGLKPFSAEQLDQMLAPIALYPDGLLAQLLMAATYPVEVIDAARWCEANPNLKGEAAVTAVKDKNWDVSIKSLVAFPQVLDMMSKKLDWTQNVGDAMLGQQSDVAASVQRLRKQAQDAGNLKSTPQLKVTTQAVSADAPAGTPPPIVIEPADPQTVYIPTYNPNYTYGTWPYPSYPPTYFPPPPGYGYGAVVPGILGGLAFGLGFGIGVGFFGGWAWGGGWGGGWGWRGWGWNGWGGGWHGWDSHVTINHNVTRIDNNYHEGRWEHDAEHRHGTPYRDPGHREKSGQDRRDAGEREAFRARENREPRASGLQGAGREPRTADREDRERDDRGYHDRNHAFSDARHGHQVNHEAARGHRYHGHPHTAAHSHYHGHGGGHKGRK